MATFDAAVYVRMLGEALDALTKARLYCEDQNWRPAFADLILLDSLRSQDEVTDAWWPVDGADPSMIAIVLVNQGIEIPDAFWEYLDEDVHKALRAAGRLATEDDEVCGGCGQRWPEGTGEVIECEVEGCPGTCPECQNDPCPHHEGASA